MKRTIAVLLLSFCFAGCVEIEVLTKLKENGSGTQHWKFTTTALLGSEIKKQIQSSRFFGKSIWKDQYKDGDYVLETTLSFDDVSDLRNMDRDVRFESKGLLLKQHTYTEVWKRSGDSSGLLAQHAGGLVPVTLKIGVELPGTIVESNADFKEGSIAQWNIPVSDLLSSKVLVARSQSWNWTLVAPALLLLTGTFVALVIVVVRLARQTRPSAMIKQIPCSSCGAKVVEGSTFCSFCGAKI